MRGETILLVDDEKLIRWSLKKELERIGFGVLEAETIRQAVTLLETSDPDLLVLDQRLPDGSGTDLLAHMKNEGKSVPVIMLTAVDKARTAIEAMKLGVFEYVTKPVDFEELQSLIEKALEATRLRRQVVHFVQSGQRKEGFCGLLGASPPIQLVFDLITKIAASPSTTVLITGESGTGKELVARAIHFLSERQNEPLMTVNCTALTETLVEAELFGHEKGAFTDAKSQKKGLFELAHRGTIFLDEIGDISQRLQAKLLRVLESKAFQRVGGTQEITVDVRIVTATNRRLEEKVDAGEFRSDLYYRLDVAHIHLPPLRDRGDDIVLIADHFVSDFSQKYQRQFRGFTDDAKELIRSYRWPGNVRELRNVLERVVLLSEGTHICAHQLELSPVRDRRNTLQVDIGEEGIALDELERQALMIAMEKAGHNKSLAARLLKISRDELRYKIKKHNLMRPTS